MENNIDYQDYQDNYKRYFSSLSCEQMIDIIDYLKGKSTSGEFEEIDDCAVDLLSRFLTMDWGRSIVIEYTKEQKKFIKSTYLSNFFKESIKEMLGDTISEKVNEVLNSEKNINDMTEEEIKTIREAIEEYYRINRKSPKSNISSRFMSYIYKLNGKGVASYIKNNIPPYELAKHMLITSGVNDRASYYSGRGVNYGDLSDKNLAAIYKKLYILDYKYASSFVWLVNNMRTLGATEFIESFLNLGRVGFDTTKYNIVSDKNISLDGLKGEAAYLVGAISFFETSRRNEEYQIDASECMKLAFHRRIDCLHRKAENGEFLTEEELEKLGDITAGNYRYELICMKKTGRRKKY